MTKDTLGELKPFVVKLQKDENRQSLLKPPDQTTKFRSGQVILKPGESVGEHSTKDKEEIIFVFNGKAEISSNKSVPLVIEKESIAYMPPHTTHNVKNIGRDVLKYIYIVTQL